MSIPAYGAPEIRYSDRDVREDPDLHYLAVAYVQVYGGEFDPLVAAKNELATSGTLSTRTARVVLNCMRYDVNVSATLPAPQPPPVDFTPVRRRTQRYRAPEDRQCDNPESHSAHSWTPEDCEGAYARCTGVPFAINRGMFDLPATIKRKYALARGGKLIHKTTGQGWMVWYPPWHEYGYGPLPPQLLVRTACTQTTRRLSNPILLDAIPDIGEYAFREPCTQGCFDG